MLWKLTFHNTDLPLTAVQEMAQEHGWLEAESHDLAHVFSFRPEGRNAVVTCNAVLPLAEIIGHFSDRVKFDRVVLEKQPPTEGDVRATERFLASTQEG